MKRSSRNTSKWRMSTARWRLAGPPPCLARSLGRGLLGRSLGRRLGYRHEFKLITALDPFIATRNCCGGEAVVGTVHVPPEARVAGESCVVGSVSIGSADLMGSSPRTSVVGRTDLCPKVISSGRPAFPAHAPDAGVDTCVSSTVVSDDYVSYSNSGRPADSGRCSNAKSGGRPAALSYSSLEEHPAEGWVATDRQISGGSCKHWVVRDGRWRRQVDTVARLIPWVTQKVHGHRRGYKAQERR